MATICPHRFAFGALSSVIFLLAIRFSYVLFIQESNAHLGYAKLSCPIYQIVAMFLITVCFGLLLSKPIVRPSDLFVHIYFIFLLMPYSALAGVRAEIQLPTYLLVLLILIVPLAFLYMGRGVRICLKFRTALISERTAILSLLLFSVLGVVFIFLINLKCATFDIDSVYVRRLAAREYFKAGALKSYVISMVCNGVLPTLAFFGAAHKRQLLLIMSVVCLGCFYYVLGLKAPMLFGIIGVFAGVLFRASAFKQVGRIFFVSIIIIFAIFYLELLFNEYSFVGDYALRRAFAVPAYLISVYVEIFINLLSSGSLWTGVATNLPVSMYVGEYLGDPTLNANTNSFLYALLGGGVGLYFVHIIVVVFALRFCDCCYASRHDGMWMWIALLFSLLVIEQSVTTVLLSSGVALVIFVFFVADSSLHRHLPQKNFQAIHSR